MRIVHVVQSLGLGGQERVILSLTQELSRRGHAVAIASMSPGGELRASFDVPVFDVPRKGGFDAFVIARMARTLASFGPDVVHTHNPAPMIYAIPAARSILVRRTIHTKHGANIYSRKSLAAARVVARVVSAFVAVSEETAQVARDKEKVPDRLLHVIPNGIDTKAFTRDDDARLAIRSQLGIPSKALVVGIVGRLAPEKRVDALLRAIAPKLNDDLQVVVVGDGPDRDLVAREAKLAGHFVHVVGMQTDIPRWMSAFDLLALASSTEGLPLVVPEAMASGLPVVAPRVGGLPTAVADDSGVLAPLGDDAALVAAICKLAEDRERLGRLAKGAKARATDALSLETMVDRYEALYLGR